MLRGLAIAALALLCASPTSGPWLAASAPTAVQAPEPAPSPPQLVGVAAPAQPSEDATRRPRKASSTPRPQHRPRDRDPVEPPQRDAVKRPPRDAGSRPASEPPPRATDLPPAPEPPPPTPPLPPGAVPRGRYHLVQPGDTAGAVAMTYGLRDQWLVYDANPFLVRPDPLPAGSWLYIPHPAVPVASRPRPGAPGWSEDADNVVLVDQLWLNLAACESSGNWGIASGNGYFGGLQFRLDSWQLVGGAGYPHQAQPIEQIARADALQRLQGWKAWPVCSRRLGLRR